MKKLEWLPNCTSGASWVYFRDQNCTCLDFSRIKVFLGPICSPYFVLLWGFLPESKPLLQIFQGTLNNRKTFNLLQRFLGGCFRDDPVKLACKRSCFMKYLIHQGQNSTEQYSQVFYEKHFFFFYKNCTRLVFNASPLIAKSNAEKLKGLLNLFTCFFANHPRFQVMLVVRKIEV